LLANLTHTFYFSDMFVTVGWGKKETQFHGSEGKAAAKLPTQVDPNPAFDWDDKKPRIRWRGDSEYFAISYIDAYTSEFVDTYFLSNLIVNFS
jgi:elongator complex protein 1